MILLITSFLAGGLTVLAPCVVAVLPALLARSIDGTRRHSPYVVIGSVASSVFVFSILLKATTLLIDVPTSVWASISGGIIAFFGVLLIWPGLWDRVSLRLGFGVATQRQLAAAGMRRGVWGDIVIGASLGPVFSACSPTYGLIVASILPATPIQGIIYLLSYVAGLSLMLGVIAVFGRAAVKKLGWGVNPHGMLRRLLGLLLLVLGLMIVFGVDKDILAWAVAGGLFDWQVQLEQNLTTSGIL